LFNEVFDATEITGLLLPNRSVAGLYRSANKFQCRRVLKWRGGKEPIKLMPCPLSVDNETKTEECRIVVLSMLELASFIKVRKKMATQTGGTQLETVDGHNKRWHLLVDDGLTQLRVLRLLSTSVSNTKNC
jgi:hypothetical protein